MINTLPIDSIRLGGEIGRRIDITARNNLLAVDIDGDFLEPFKARDAESLYIGVGHFLDALSRLSAYSGDKDLISLKDHVISTLAATREENGYIGLFPDSRRLSHLWDVHETSHLIYGLSNDHFYWSDSRSLDLAVGLARYLIETWSGDPDRVASQFVMSTLDLEPALLALHGRTGNEAFLDFCVHERDLPGWNRPIVEGRWGRIEGHVYDYLSRCIAQLTLMQWEPGFGLTRTTRRALEYMLHGDGMVITGGLGEKECWHSTQEGTAHLGETCATAYLIRLLHLLLIQTGDSVFGDLMERAVYNALFAAQSPDGRHIRYFTPFDGVRKYFGPDTYCCPSNFRRIISELPEMVCYPKSSGFLFNLYSDATIETRAPGNGDVGLRIAMKTDYPANGAVEIEFAPERSVAFDIDLRIPRWCTHGAVRVNGRAAERTVTGGRFFRVSKTWQKGDVVEIDLEMPVRLVSGRKAQTGRVAIMRGPQMYCVNRSRHPEPANMDPRLLVLDPNGGFDVVADDSVRPGGRGVGIKTWSTDSWYPVTASDLTITCTEFADPGGEAAYFKTPVPDDPRFEQDELLGARISEGGANAGIRALGFYDDDLLTSQSNEEDASILTRLQSPEP